ncbi:MAG: DNA-binding protein [Clostridia bacterium]|nr:DNA-binding protein [Clostridia bacterium]
MKKALTICLAVVAVIAIVVSGVFGSQKGNLQKTIDEVTQQLADAQAAAETAKADLEQQLADAASAAEGVKADLEQQLADAQAAVEAAKADVEKQLADAQEAAKAELEKAQAEADAKIAELESAAAELQGKLTKAERAVVAAKSNAYLMYANSDWSVQNWGTEDSEDGAVIVTPAAVTGEGDYTVALEFAQPAEGLAFTALGIQKGEFDLPYYSYRINAIRVNGEGVEFTKGYTSSDDGKETRVNIYNEWVSALPEDAHTADGDLTDASPIIVNKDAFTGVTKVEVDFTAIPLQAYLMFANSDWTVQFWNDGNVAEGVTPILAAVTGEGEGTVGLEFAEPSEGLAFAAVGIKNGEKLIPGYIIQVTGVYLNDSEENILTGKSYTNSDDKVETRANVYNEWVSALPEDARTADGNLEDASPMIVDKEAFTGVTSVKVTYRIVEGKPAAATAEAPMSQEEADALKAAGFHAYIGVQGKNTYVFRNAWNDSYGLNDEANPFFYRLTGWDDSNNALDLGGSFVDADINGDGEYTVSLTTGEQGFLTTEAFNLLFASTDIPSKLVIDGYLTLSDVKTKIGDAATQDYTQIDTEGDYVRIVVLDSYNQSAEPFGYTVPGAEAPISITFTVSGW